MSEKVVVNLPEDIQTTMDFDSILLDVLRSRGQERFKIKPKQKEALQKIVLDSQDCLIVLPTGYGKSLIYQLLPSLFDRVVSKEFEGQSGCDRSLPTKCTDRRSNK